MEGHLFCRGWRKNRYTEELWHAIGMRQRYIDGGQNHVYATVPVMAVSGRRGLYAAFSGLHSAIKGYADASRSH